MARQSTLNCCKRIYIGTVSGFDRPQPPGYTIVKCIAGLHNDLGIKFVNFKSNLKWGLEFNINSTDEGFMVQYLIIAIRSRRIVAFIVNVDTIVAHNEDLFNLLLYPK